MHLVSDDSLNGMPTSSIACRRALWLTIPQGRAFAVVPRQSNPSGYIDISDRDALDIENVVESEWLSKS